MTLRLLSVELAFMFQALVESMPKLTVCVNPVGSSFGLIPVAPVN